MNVVYVAPDRFLHPYFDDVLEALGDSATIALYDFDQPPLPQLEGVSVVIEHGCGFSTPDMWDAAVAAGVRLWQVTATGLDHMDVDSFLERGLPISNMPGLSSTAVPMAEHALTLMLASAKRLTESRRNLEAGRLYEPLTSELYGKTLGLVGAGASGRELARRASACGMRILAIDAVEVPAQVCAELGIDFLGGLEKLDQLLSASDYLSLHVPLTKDTRGLLDRRRLALLKPGAVVINVARGPLLDEQALLEALQEGRLAGAGLDVFADEPINPAHPLLALDNVIATPHNGVVSRELSVRRAGVARENIDRVSRGDPPLYQVFGTT